MPLLPMILVPWVEFLFPTLRNSRLNHLDMNVFYNDSKTDVKLRCDNYMNSTNSGVTKVWSRLMTVCCMLLPHNPYRLPQHYKRQVCVPLL